MHRYLLLRTCALLALLLVAGGWATPAAAAPSFDNCTGFLQLGGDGRTGINAPGTWCLEHDLTGPITAPSAVRISIYAHDVVLDCKGFRISGDPSGAVFDTGIRMLDHQRLTIRNCVIEGFSTGIQVLWIDAETRGVLIEDNILVDNHYAIETEVADSLVRRNQVRGSALGIAAAYGSDVVDNLVEGVSDFGVALIHPQGGEVRGNTIRMPGNSSGTTHAIRIVNTDTTAGRHRASIRDNVIVGGLNSVGVSCFHPAGRYADNLFTGVANVNEGCTDAGDNDASP